MQSNFGDFKGTLIAGKATLPRIGIFTILDPGNFGGLESYISGLTAGLEEVGAKVMLNGSEPSKKSNIGVAWKARINLLLPLMSRRSFRFIASTIASNLGASWTREVVGCCDIVHFVGTGWELLGFPLQRSARRSGKTISCLPAVHPGSWGDSTLDLDLYNRMDAVFVLSEYEKEYLVTRGAPREKLVLCGCAPSSSVTGDGKRFRQLHGLAGKEIVLFVGRKTNEKGYHALRSAVARMIDSRKNLVLVSIGRDVSPPYPILPKGLDIDVGAADEATKQDALAACDLLALPSEAESFGIVYVEAWRYGKPVICGNAPASLELIRKHNGGLATDGSPLDIEEKLRMLLSNHSTAKKFGEAGRIAATENYNWDKVTETHLQTWHGLLRP